MITTTARPSKVMYYSHDTYGLGHLRRTLTLAGFLGERRPAPSQLIVTGSPVAHGFAIPDGVDYIKLPAVVKVGAGEYEPRSLATSFACVRDMRADLLLGAARHFQPDVFVVDHAPAGLKGEVVPTLRYLRRCLPDARLVLGLRDVVDEAPRVREDWLREEVYALLDDVYHRILVYGERDVYDVAREYGFSERAAAKTRFVGYLDREPGRRPAAAVRAELRLRTGRLVLVTAGGGGDGYDLFRAMLDGLRERRGDLGFDCLLIGGPLMSAADRQALLELTRDGIGVHFLDFTDDMGSYLGAADAVVSMGGYNSVCEILALGRPALIVPRVTPRAEQLIRAEALSRRGLLRMLHPAALTASRLLAAVEALLARPPAAQPLEMRGLPAFAAELDGLMRRPAQAMPQRALAGARSR